MKITEQQVIDLYTLVAKMRHQQKVFFKSNARDRKALSFAKDLERRVDILLSEIDKSQPDIFSEL